MLTNRQKCRKTVMQPRKMSKYGNKKFKYVEKL